jgi:hypothetical protein
MLGRFLSDSYVSNYFTQIPVSEKIDYTNIIKNQNRQEQLRN